MKDRMMTLHPEGKTVVNISRHKYDVVRKPLNDSAWRQRPDLTFPSREAIMARILAREASGPPGHPRIPEGKRSK